MLMQYIEKSNKICMNYCWFNNNLIELSHENAFLSNQASNHLLITAHQIL